MSLPAHTESTSKQMKALRTLAGLTTKEDLLDHIEASKV